MREDYNNFVEPIAVNDWESVGWYLKATKSEAGTWSHATLDQSYRLKNGDKVEVRWPTGAFTNERICIRKVPRCYRDHGHVRDR